MTYAKVVVVDRDQAQLTSVRCGAARTHYYVAHMKKYAVDKYSSPACLTNAGDDEFAGCLRRLYYDREASVIISVTSHSYSLVV